MDETAEVIRLRDENKFLRDEIVRLRNKIAANNLFYSWRLGAVVDPFEKSKNIDRSEIRTSVKHRREAEALRLYMESNGLSQQQMGEKIGVTYGTICSYLSCNMRINKRRFREHGIHIDWEVDKFEET